MSRKCHANVAQMSRKCHANVTQILGYLFKEIHPGTDGTKLSSSTTFFPSGLVNHIHIL